MFSKLLNSARSAMVVPYKCVVLYGSQTGASEEIAKQIYERGTTEGTLPFPMRVEELDTFATKISQISRPSRIVMVCSSTGEGDPPDNSIKFFGKLKKLLREQKKRLDSDPDSPLTFSNCKYTLLGLGDSNYSSYQGAPKTLDKMMTLLGATYFYPKALVDEVKGLEEQVENWIEGLWDPLQETLVEMKQLIDSGSVPTTTPKKKKPTFTKKKMPDVPANRLTLLPATKSVSWKEEETLDSSKLSVTETLPLFPSELYGPKRKDDCHPITIKSARWLTATSSVKHTIKLELSLPSGYPSFRSGDSIGIFPPNEAKQVEYILSRLEYPTEVDGHTNCQYTTEDQSTFPSHLSNLFPTSIHTLLTWACDLSSIPKKSFLRLLAEYTSDKEEKEKLTLWSSVDGKGEFTKNIENFRPNLSTLLEMFPSCKPSASHLIGCLPPLAPRYYSISSGPRDDCSARVTFSVDRGISVDGKEWKGVCTNWLAGLAVDSGMTELGSRPSLSHGSVKHGDPVRVQGFHYLSSLFHLPDDEEEWKLPRIMVGPGTGIAPFIGFLETLEKKSEGERGDSTLFFGCRHPERDYLYEEELNSFKDNGVLSTLVTAFSRLTEGDVCYVQHKMNDMADAIGDILIEQNGFLYVCGDAKGMWRDVSKVTQAIIQKKLAISEEEGVTKFQELVTNKKILFDVWG